MRSAAYGSSTRPGLALHHANSSSSSSSQSHSQSHNHSPWAATPLHGVHNAVNSHAAASAYPPLGAPPPPASTAGSGAGAAAAAAASAASRGVDSSASGQQHQLHQQHQSGHHAHQHGSHNHHSLSSAGQNSLQNASTALDRVLAMLDGFEDDMDCPLCLEEMDISDLNFKPCPCGYQICRFCYHHIKENLNNRCPACRTPYDDATVEFKAIKPDEMKRLQAAKKLRDKRRKETEAVMQNKANVRVRQRTLVHITGMTTKQANEDTLAQLKSPEHFGRFGKIVRLFMSKRSPTAPGTGPLHPVFQPVNVYISYRTASEASHCIAATDGTYSIEGNKLRAMWGTTRYCPNYLKGIRCSDVTCTFAHEAGEEIDGLATPNARDEIFTYDSETSVKPRAATPTIAAKKAPEVTLPATASWASKNAPPQPTTPIVLNPHLPPLSATLPKPAPPRTISVAKPQNHPLPARPSSRAKAANAAAASKEQQQAGGAAAATATSSAAAAAAAKANSVSSGSSPAPSTPSSPSLSSAPTTAPEGNSSKDSNSAIGTAPVASTSRSPSPRIASPAPPADPFAAFTSSFSSAYSSPLFEVPSVPSFPDFDFGESAFSFSLNLDVKGKGRAVNSAATNAASTPGGEEIMPFRDFANLEGFGRPAEPLSAPSPVASGTASESNGPTSAFMASGLSSATTSSSYMGSFDPFSENAFSGFGSSDLQSRSPTPPSTNEAEDLAAPRGSRFGFARRSSNDAPLQSVQGMLSAAARSAFGGALAGMNGVRDISPGAQTPFAPPGIGLPLRSASSGFAPLPPLGGGDQQQQQQHQQQQHQHQQQQQQREWNGNTMNGGPTFPPGVLRSLATPGGSTASSPQMSPRARATHPQHPQSHGYGHGPPLPPGLGAPGGAANSALPPPPGLMPSQHARPAIPAASFPLPPPAPRPNGTTVNSGSTNVAKEDLLALIAAAQASAPKPQQQQQYGGHGQQQQQQQQHPFFSDPAILNARLASTGGAADASLPPPGPGPALPPLQHPYGLGQGGSPFPPGMRLPPFHQQGQQQQQQH
ncbi:hypothetical protein JCM10908_002156 [Rhodotorula pacifica]|uniref:CCR4-NOT core ubiquitin-protein ligase subunit MOT2 n=1 Tax=Rhodotorula pacifica TaxID=1495444 RepID=UPI003177CAA1